MIECQQCTVKSIFILLSQVFE